ncbi:hypothetical protein GGF46_004035 [Coemansia sp. RSA 552]|nr:hypothetical protein GGF46_004035 [Coemansia sp. RSA 552]
MISHAVVRRAAVLARSPGAAAAGAARRAYTNTSVYTRSDHMSHEQYLKAMLEEQQYLCELLKTDDSAAPWHKENVETVSREVQDNLHEPRGWSPDDALHG